MLLQIPLICRWHKGCGRWAIAARIGATGTRGGGNGTGNRAEAAGQRFLRRAPQGVGRANFLEAEAGIAPTRPAAYVFTPSAIDDTLAPPGKHGAYIACAAYPARFADGATWRARGEMEAHRLVDAVAERAPGFRESITGLAWRHAEDWECEIGLLDGHPMHLDLTMDQLGPFRPLSDLANHRTPIEGLYLSGAGTYPTGGVSGVPGRVAAKVILKDRQRKRP